jgi:lipopolysaccharide export system permease protein
MKFHPSSAPGMTGRRFLTVLDRMISLELCKTLCAVLGLIVLIIVSRRFLNILSKAIEGDISGNTLFLLLGLKMVSAMITLTPAALFLAVLMVLGRMYRDQEMAVLASGGVGLARLYRSVYLLVVPLSVLSAGLALQVMPWSEQQAQALLISDEKQADARGIKAGRFNEFSQGDVVLYAEELTQDNKMRNIFVQNRQQERLGITIAETGYLKEEGKDKRFVMLEHGYRYQGVPGQADFIVSEFDEYAVRLFDSEREQAAKKEAEPTLNLLHRGGRWDMAELQRRSTIPLGVLFLTLLAIPLARVAPRGGVYGNVFTAFLIYIVYENLQRVSQASIMTNKLPMWLAFSGVYLLVVLTAVVLLARSLGLRWMLQAIRERFQT